VLISAQADLVVARRPTDDVLHRGPLRQRLERERDLALGVLAALG
jgi:hypothetical protein